MLARPTLAYSNYRDSTNRPIYPFPDYSLVQLDVQFGGRQTEYRRAGAAQWWAQWGWGAYTTNGYSFMIPGVAATYGCWTQFSYTGSATDSNSSPLPASLRIGETVVQPCPQAPWAVNPAAPARWNWVTVVHPSARPGRANVCIGVGGFGDSFACARIDQSGNIDADTVLWVLE